MVPKEERFRLPTPRGDVSAVWASPDDPIATLVVAPGAGSSLDHPFMTGFTDAVNALGIATLRFNFLYKETRKVAPDREPILREVWLLAFAEATQRSFGAAPFVGGKSMGGRIASLCVADGMPARGLVFLGYPLHPPRDPEALRDAHLYGIRVPMLFLQGTRDPFARPDKLHPVIAKLRKRARLVEIEGGDHSMRVKGGGKKDAEVSAGLAPTVADFIRESL
jgi:predicted alpha/beta-hydrolase family hydrolase